MLTAVKNSIISTVTFLRRLRQHCTQPKLAVYAVRDQNHSFRSPKATFRQRRDTHNDHTLSSNDINMKAIVVGVRYRDEQTIKNYKAAPLPVEVTLVPEPDNPHDPHAIKVLLDDEHIGYIAKSQTGKIHRRYNSLKRVRLIPGPTPMNPFVSMTYSSEAPDILIDM